jgi:sulfide:quinone oxidoreductase
VTERISHQVVVIGGGNAGVSLAARLRRSGLTDIAIIEPADTHYYQPLWTLVGGGCVKASTSARPEASVMPQGVGWIKDRACEIDPDKQTVSTHGGVEVGYDHLVVCPGIQLDWSAIPGMAESLDTPRVSSNYQYDLAPKTWELIRKMRSGTAVFTMPSGPIKCAGAPQKIAYLAADYWRGQGALRNIRVVLVLPTPGMFGIKTFADELERVVERYGIDVRKNSEVTTVNPSTRTVTITDNASETTQEVGYDMLHVVPRQSAPDWIKASSVSALDIPGGYVDADKNTMRHNGFDNVFALGDVGSTPNSKTGAAIRKQAPVVAANLHDSLAGKPLSGSYGGYGSCPLTTARNKLLLAEFDYSMEPTPSIPLIDTTHERRDMWLLKRYGLPAMYWNLILKGLA